MKIANPPDPSTDPDEAKNQPSPASADLQNEPAASVPTAPEVTDEKTAPEAAADNPVEPAVPDDVATDNAVEAIVKQEGDEVLQAEDEAAEKAIVTKTGRWQRLKNLIAGWWANPRARYGALGGVALIIATSFAIPLTRYDILGLVFEQQVTVTAIDSKSGLPISGAMLSLGGQQLKTEASGNAVFRAHLGSKALSVNKKYYRGYSHKEQVTFSAAHNHFRASLLALGQQVQVKVVNKISGRPVGGATVNVHGAQTKTNPSGIAVVQIPSGADTQSAKVSLGSYNTVAATITAGNDIAKNTFAITPAGKLYFLSNLSGKIDVVKTNLDGTDRQTVLAGTGDEDPSSTSLLASRDWKYLALLSRRAGTNASVYLIDTTDGDKLTTIDQGNANYSFIGWSGDKFIYEVDRSPTLQDWQPHQQALKSLDATTGQTLLLDQTEASGSNQYDYVRQYFASSYIIGNQVVYDKNWNSGATYSPGVAVSPMAQAELDSIGVDGSGHKVVKTFPLAGNGSTVYIYPLLYEPDGMYIQAYDGNQYSYYDYDDGSISADTSMTDSTFGNTPYPTYLQSPSGNSTFWSETRDGKHTLFVGDEDGKSPKQIATLSDYNTYGWYSDNYLLVSKNSSELYIMPASGGTPLKISDYYKPAVNYNGYGGGYGGL